MLKKDLLRMIADRVKGNSITQLDIERVLDALASTLDDVLEYNIMKPNEFVRIQPNVRFVVKTKKAKVIKSTGGLVNIKTGEPIVFEDHTIPEKKLIVLEGFEVDS